MKDGAGNPPASLTDNGGRFFGGIPAGLRDPLVAAFAEIVKNYRERRWEPAELNGGKLCEVVYTILEGHVAGKFPAVPRKPPNMVDACRKLEQAGAQFPRSIRVQIPRMLMALYEVRNNRGVGHVGGDVDPNHMDATVVLSMAKWILSELVRIFHKVSSEEASEIVDALVEREVPVIWEVGGARRILDPTRTHKDKTLMLLYGALGAVSETELMSWSEHPRLADYRKDVLRPLHKQKLVEYDERSGVVTISPLGVRRVETQLPLQVPPT